MAGYPSWMRRPRDLVHEGDDRSTSPAGFGEDTIGRSEEIIGRAVEDMAALQEGFGYYKGLASELNDIVAEERERGTAAEQRLADAERERRIERERADRAEHQLDQSARLIRELEDQLDVLRSQVERLVNNVARLAPAGLDRDGGSFANEMAQLLAA